MKIVVSATGPSLNDMVEPRFGRAPWYLFVETDTMACEAVRNPNMTAGGGAGIQSAQLMSKHGVSHVLTGNCGPNAFQVFGAAGIQVVVGVGGPVGQAVEQFKAGTFAAAGRPNVESHFGMGAGASPAGGMGRGGGRGMGKGRGQGAGRSMGPADVMPQAGETKEVLQERLKTLQAQMKDIEKRLGESGGNE